MNSFTGKFYGSPRSIACIGFSVFSLFVWGAYMLMAGALSHYLSPSAIPEWVRQSLVHNINFPLGVLATAYRSLAVTALIWCVWCWRKESGLMMGIAVAMTGLALIVNVLMFF